MSKDYRDNILTARGNLHTDSDTESATVGFTNLQFWIPKLSSWIPASQDPDKFLVTAPDRDEAWQIFWDRWASYVQRRFKQPYVKIERLN